MGHTVEKPDVLTIRIPQGFRASLHDVSARSGFTISAIMRRSIEHVGEMNTVDLALWMARELKNEEKSAV